MVKSSGNKFIVELEERGFLAYMRSQEPGYMFPGVPEYEDHRPDMLGETVAAIAARDGVDTAIATLRRSLVSLEADHPERLGEVSDVLKRAAFYVADHFGDSSKIDAQQLYRDVNDFSSECDDKYQDISQLPGADQRKINKKFMAATLPEHSQGAGLGLRLKSVFAGMSLKIDSLRGAVPTVGTDGGSLQALVVGNP